MTTTNLEVAAPTEATALVTIDPKTYVATAYAPFEARLQEAVAAADGVTYEITTTAGMETAKSLRARFRDIRISCEKKRAELKAPFLEAGKLLDSRNKEIEQLVTPYEERFDADIKAEEKRKDDEKAAKLKAESERQSRLQAKIDAIKETPLKAIALNAAGTQELIAALALIVPDAENFEERFVEAELVLNASIAQLEQMVVGKRAQEELAAQQLAQAQEQTRIDAIKARIQAIKNYIVQGAECDSTQQIEYLLQKLSTATVQEDQFQEFTAEATAALATAVSALTRQLASMKLAEQTKAEADAEFARLREEAATAPAATAVAPAPAVDPAPEASTPAAVPSVASAVVGVDMGGGDATAVYVKPAPEVLRAVVVEHQDEIKSFFKTRNFSEAKENEYRAVLVEFVKHQAARSLAKAA